MRQILWGSLLTVAALLIAGCARYPADGSTTDVPPVTLYSEITLNGPINPAYYYFLAIDTDDDDGDGPVPVVTGNAPGNGWGTLSGLGPNDPIQEPPFYVIYNGGSFQQFRGGEPIGRPFRAEVVGDNKIVVEIDARDMMAPDATVPRTIQLNWITMQDLIIPPQNSGIIKDYDGLGPAGYDYLDYLALDQNRIIRNGDPDAPEEQANDTTDTPAIDIIDYEVNIQVRQPL